MKLKLLPLVTLALCALLAACPPPSPVPMPPDAADGAPADLVDAGDSPDASPVNVDAASVPDGARPAVFDSSTPDLCDRACAQLRSVGCPEGARTNCASSCRDDQALGVGAQLHPDCIADAGTKAALVKKCNVRCR